MIKKLFKHPLFLIGFTFITILLIASICHAVFFDGYVPKKTMLYDHNGEFVGMPAFPPSVIPPLGTDSSGNNLFVELIQGAKYTITIAFVVAGLRVFLSLIIGLFYSNFLMRLNKYVSGIIDAFHYVPISLAAYLLLINVLFSHGLEMNFTYSFTARIIFEFIILAVIAMPTLSVYFAAETNQINKNEFITSAKLLGGNRLYITKKHILPLLWPKLIISFFEQMIQTLILLVHLGLFHLLFGGTQVIRSAIGDSPPKFISISGEWSGLIGNSFKYIFISPWIVLVPLFAFAFLILALNFMLEGIRASLPNGIQIKKERRKKTAKIPQKVVSKEGFTFINKGA
ncbi:peptide/nickel transport system permease protein [Scopulibacillus darangshiensis]|uniref:Peptide/nickel transport system permease protein n=1 Tax=Scopulibacillus darangshiensis TaxID=442528 RepID=A0A4R2PE82_9BACL|nr:hypothetical protein [Scopulibacillus darangshiensis]TCP32235.1 peptide/nickel transport system permease protein [Scopulibacillus darangshiensis]